MDWDTRRQQNKEKLDGYKNNLAWASFYLEFIIENSLPMKKLLPNQVGLFS